LARCPSGQRVAVGQPRGSGYGDARCIKRGHIKWGSQKRLRGVRYYHCQKTRSGAEIRKGGGVATVSPKGEEENKKVKVERNENGTGVTRRVIVRVITKE
jgi:hypothetical protein